MKCLGFLPVPNRTIRRSVLHVDNLAVILASLLLTPASGTFIATDEEPFSHVALADALARATGRRPRLLALPDIAFAPLRLFLPGLYNRVYESSFARPGESIMPQEPLPISLRNGLAEIFESEHPL
jgi:nucleoside-diphosphate-sugar epimerase